MSESLTRAFASDLEVRSDSEGRTVHGIVVPFGKVARVSDGGPAYDEAFQRGAFEKFLRQRGHESVKFLLHHDRTNPIGRASLLREDAAGLYGEFRVSDTKNGNDALELIRDGVLDSFSVGFRPIQHIKKDRVTWRTEAGVREASVVTFPAYEGALVGGVRSLVEMSDDEILAFHERLATVVGSTAREGSEALDSGTPDGTAPPEAAPPVEALRSDLTPEERRTMFRLALEKRGLRT